MNFVPYNTISPYIDLIGGQVAGDLRCPAGLNRALCARRHAQADPRQALGAMEKATTQNPALAEKWRSLE